MEKNLLLMKDLFKLKEQHLYIYDFGIKKMCILTL